MRSAAFDDPLLVSSAGLVPVLALAARAGLGALADAHLTVPGGAGFDAAAKVTALVAGMVAGADSIADMDVVRHGGMGRVFTGVRAPSTLGTFLRSFRFGHVRQLDAVAARFLAGLAQHAPIISTGGSVTYLDVDDTVRAPFTRATGALASTFHAKAATATLRRQLINIAARVTHSARRSTMRLPAAWPWADQWQQLFSAAIGPPASL